MEYRIRSFRSMTHAERARRALERAGVRCSIVGLDRSLTSRGCAYGIEYRASDSAAVRRTLAPLGLDYGEVLGGGR